MSKKKPTGGRPKPSETPRVNLHLEVPPEIKEAIEALAAKNERKITAEVIIGLRNHLTANGFWPWPPPAPPKGD